MAATCRFTSRGVTDLTSIHNFLTVSKKMSSHEDEIEGQNLELFIRNPHLESLPSDYLYHLALGTNTHDLEEMFGDVKFVCVGGTQKRMQSFAYHVKEELGIKLPTGVALTDITKASGRYSMFKIGPVLSVTHGMGSPSLSILMHELLKLIMYAKCRNVVFLRLGTSGGLGVAPGTVVVTERAVDGILRPVNEVAILGRLVRIPAVFDQDLVHELLGIGKEFGDFKTVSGTTLCTADFYEGQARMDGAFCSYDVHQKRNFISRLHDAGVVNIEMEALTFGSMCYSAGVPVAIVCVTLLDRLVGDQIVTPDIDYEEMTQRPLKLVSKFISKRLAVPQFNA